MTIPTPSIQGFYGPNTVQSSGNTQCAVDWMRGKVFIGGDAENEISRSDIASGTEEASTALSVYTDVINHIAVSAPSIGLDSAGNIYFSINAGILKASGSSFASLGTWGSYATALPPGLPDSTVVGQTTGPIGNVPGGVFNIPMGAGGLFAFENDFFVTQNGNQFAGYEAEWAGNNALVCAGVGSYAFIISSFNSGTGTHPITFYSINAVAGGTWVPGDWPTPNPNITVDTVVAVAPTDIDAFWTEITCGGMCCDQTDGNILAIVVGQAGAGQLEYIIKLNSVTGAVMWKTAIPGATVAGDQMQYSRVVSPVFCFFVANESAHPPNTVLIVNTVDGTIKSYTGQLNGMVVFGPQCFDSVTGKIILSVDYTGGAGSPPAEGGTPIPFVGWAALKVLPDLVLQIIPVYPPVALPKPPHDSDPFLLMMEAK